MTRLVHDFVQHGAWCSLVAMRVFYFVYAVNTKKEIKNYSEQLRKGNDRNNNEQILLYRQLDGSLYKAGGRARGEEGGLPFIAFHCLSIVVHCRPLPSIANAGGREHIKLWPSAQTVVGRTSSCSCTPQGTRLP